MGHLFEDLLHPDAYPDPRPKAVELRETHISAVHLLEADVYKVKKPVNFGFLDFSTREQRRAACEAEVRLNRRLSPDVYLGVVPITRDSKGQHHIGGEGEVVEHAVHMRRLPDEERADLLLARGALGPPEVDRIAEAIVRFHASCRSDETTAEHGKAEAIAVNVEENFAQTRDVLTHYMSDAEAAEIEEYQRGALVELSHIFAERIERGAVRDGHGDLRLEHVYLRPNGEVTILDCIEFNDRFRYADIACDLAFLTMDLTHMRRADLAEQLLLTYAQKSNDFDLYSVIDFYESYRAFVRAKISTFLAENEAAPHALRTAAKDDARRHFLLAIAAERSQLLRRVVVAVGGIIAAGKSTLAAWISEQLSAPVVEADRTRKSMLGVSATTKVHDGAFAGAYDKSFTDRVYSELMRRASVVLASGRPVVLDASFRSPEMRMAAKELARSHGVPFYFVECRAPASICKERLSQRQNQSSTVSDGRLAIFDDFVREWQSPAELGPSEHIVVDTSRPPDETHREVVDKIAVWPRGLTG